MEGILIVPLTHGRRWCASQTGASGRCPMRGAHYLTILCIYSSGRHFNATPNGTAGSVTEGMAKPFDTPRFSGLFEA